MTHQNTYDDCAEQYEAMISARDEEHFSGDTLARVFFDLIGDVEGLRVLDAGCGEGFVARVLQRRGGIVTAIDVAANLVEKGRKKNGSGIHYMVADLSKPLPQFEGQFDVVASYFVLNDVPDYKGFISTIGSVTKVGGRAIFGLNNPYSAVLREKAETYFDSGTVRLYQGMSSSGVRVYHYHRTMGDYIKAFTKSGFLLRSLIEPRPNPQESEERRTRWYQVPFQIAIELVKVEV